MAKKHVCVGMIGAIGSGKSTVAKLLAEKYNLAIVNPDDYWNRGEQYTPERARENWAKAMGEEYKCVKSGQSFIIDTASRLPIARKELTSVVQAWSVGKFTDDFIVVGVYVKTDLNICLRRNDERGATRQPAERVLEYWQALEKNPPAMEADGFDRLYVINGNVGKERLQIPNVKEMLS